MSNLSVKDLFRTEYRNLRSACWELGELEQKALSARNTSIEMLAFVVAGVVYLAVAPLLFPALLIFFSTILLLVVALIWSITNPSLIGFWDKGTFTFQKFFTSVYEGWADFNILEGAGRFYFAFTHPSAWFRELDNLEIIVTIICYIFLLAFILTAIIEAFRLAFYASRRNRCLARARSSYETVENLRSKHQLRLKETIEDNLHEMHDYIYS